MAFEEVSDINATHFGNIILTTSRRIHLKISTSMQDRQEVKAMKTVDVSFYESCCLKWVGE